MPGSKPTQPAHSDTHVAFLRAINVAGHAKVKMADLRDAFTAAGCANVRSYIQSGNIVFDTPAKAAATRRRAIQSQLSQLFGSEPTVMYRTRREMERILAAAPFEGLETRAGVKLYVTFLARKPHCQPGRQPVLPLKLPKEGLEIVLADHLEVYVVSRRKRNGGYGFPNVFVEKEFGVAATSRNWTTVRKIAALLDK